MSLIAFLLIGALAGFVSRAIIPGARSMGMAAAMGLGVGGARGLAWGRWRSWGCGGGGGGGGAGGEGGGGGGVGGVGADCWRGELMRGNSPVRAPGSLLVGLSCLVITGFFIGVNCPRCV